MGMTITEKILAQHAGQEAVEPGEIISAKIDIALANDVTAPIAISEFRKYGGKRVFDNTKIALVPDHFTPNKDIQSAEHCKILREFAREQGLVNYFEQGEVGVEHALLPEKGVVLPGDVIIGADSHTCTYGALGAFATGVGSTDIACAMMTGKAWFRVPETIKFIYKGVLPRWIDGKDLILHTIGDIGVEGAHYMAMEFTGEAINQLTMAGRFTMANMAIEAGAKNGIFIPDEKTREYVEERKSRGYAFFTSDADAAYADVKEYDVSQLEPQVALPHLPSNARSVNSIGDISIDQVVIGSCTNGRIEDLRVAAEVLQGRTVAPYVRLIILPATPAIYQQALNEGLIQIFLDSKAVVGPPTCGPCLGGHMGVLAKGERAVATTNRNFVGRMGDSQSEVYLAGPAVAAASAVLGKIAGPQSL
ncbi:MAG TPA: 3-isopropylmalate dehydratase large subunit [Thermodesulfobacteriota bacterium]|nr:3-isopropylmalate dehydratase large subunit [Deltaproteobacteria bacterium]HNR14685.1 3-isopropylmalate dehydratase large subunit [Thermodesulfobacteriota bacterium]